MSELWKYHKEKRIAKAIRYLLDSEYLPGDSKDKFECVKGFFELPANRVALGRVLMALQEPTRKRKDANAETQQLSKKRHYQNRKKQRQ